MERDWFMGQVAAFAGMRVVHIAPVLTLRKTPGFLAGIARMKIHEYQAKQLLREAGAPVPNGVVASNAAEVLAAYDKMGGVAVLKAQIHAGGRGKGRFKDSGKDFGGVKVVKNRTECQTVAETM